MAKVKFKLKFTGLELEFEGDRADAPQFASKVIEAMVAPADVTPPPRALEERMPEKIVEVAPESAAKPKAKGRKATAGAPQSSKATQSTINLHHDVGKWGTPKQQWPIIHKILWLMQVLSSDESTKDKLTASTIVHTFNHNFKEAGRIDHKNLSRELGRLKLQQLIGQNTHSDPPTWHLTQEGIKKAASLVEEARGKKADLI